MSNLIVQTNTMALNSHRNLKVVGAMQQKASSRLSSGFKINTAADDAAGLAISEKMRAQIRGLDMASKNSLDANSLITTAEGGMQEIDNMVQRIRELVVQAANDTNDYNSADRDKLQDEINQLTKGIDNMASQVEFNKKKLLDGSLLDHSAKSANVAEIQQWLNSKIGAVSGTQVTSGSGELGQLMTKGVSFDTIASQAYIASVASAASVGSIDTVASVASAASAASVGSIASIGSIDSVDSIASFGTTPSVGSVASQDSVASQASVGSTGSVASVASANSVDSVDSIAAVTSQNASPSIDSVAAMVATDFEDAKALTEYIGKLNAYMAGLDVAIRSGVQNLEQLKTDASVAIETARELFAGQQEVIAKDYALNAISSQTVSTGLWFQTGANSQQGIQAGIAGVRTDFLGIGDGHGNSRINVKQPLGEGVSGFINVVDNALTYVTAQRARLGAISNRLDYTQKSLDISSENLAASESRIRDADMAKEMITMTKANILQQAGVSMLSQANQAPQSVLSLLR